MLVFALHFILQSISITFWSLEFKHLSKQHCCNAQIVYDVLVWSHSFLTVIVVVQDCVFGSFVGFLALRTTSAPLCAVEAGYLVGYCTIILRRREDDVYGWQRGRKWSNKHALIVATFSFRKWFGLPAFCGHLSLSHFV